MSLSKAANLARTIFKKHPLVANSFVYGVLYVGAEFSQQTLTRKFLTEKPVDYDLPMLSRYSIIGSIINGPILFYCYLEMQHDGEPLAYDLHMITRFGVLGIAIYPQVYYYWYRWLDKKFVGTTLKIVGKKLLLDQFLLTPPLLVIFFVGMSLMERKTNYLEECKSKLVPTFQTSCMFWLPAQAINFMVVPPAFRVIYVGSCAFVWVNILCWIKRQKY